MQKHLSLLGLAALLVGLGGCIHTPRAIAASTLPLEQGKYTIIGEANDSDCAWALFGVIPVTPGNKTRDAIKEAIKGAGNGADGLIQVSVDTYYQHWIVISRERTQVDGIAIKSQK